MDEDWNQAPPPPRGESSSVDSLSVLNDFRKRISELEETVELKALSAEAELKVMIKSEIQQRMEIKMIVILIAICVLIFMAGILTHSSHTFASKDLTKVPAMLLLAMFVGPVIAISTVTGLLLFGAFRNFREDDLSKVNVASLAGEVVKGANSP